MKNKMFRNDMQRLYVNSAQSRMRGLNPYGLFHWVASLILFVLALSFCSYTQAFNPGVTAKSVGTFLGETTIHFPKVLQHKTIIELARDSEKIGGTEKVGKRLGKLNLPNEVLEDIYARILIAQNRVSRSEAEGWMHRLSGIDGFRATMRKCSSANMAGFVGHVNEIRIADNAVMNSFSIKGIGVPFKDPLKKGMTDIDVILVKGRREYVVEAKSYTSTTPIPLDVFRADMATLVEYRKANPSKDMRAVFQITEMPSDPNMRRLIEEAAKYYNVELIYGDPAGLIEQIKLLP